MPSRADPGGERLRLSLLAAATLVLAACGRPSDPTATASTDAPEAPISGPAESPGRNRNGKHAASCPLRPPARSTRRRILVVAHRGGPTRDYPAECHREPWNARRKAGTQAVEIDIAVDAGRRSRLTLMSSMTTSTAPPTARTSSPTTRWREIQALKLQDRQQTDRLPPADNFRRRFEWAVTNNALLELDKKTLRRLRADHRSRPRREAERQHPPHHLHR